MGKLVQFDWAIKYLLRNKANFDVLEGFLSELLKTQIQIESVLESESNKNHAKDKSNRVDLLVRSAQGEHIIVEVQCEREWDYLSRILYGVSKAVCEHIHEGEAYTKIRKIISVSIVFFDLGAGKDYLYKGGTVFTGIHFGDTLTLNPKEREAYEATHQQEYETPEKVFPEYYIIKVTQFKERVQDKIDEWVYFLKYGEIKKEFSAQGIQSAAKKLDMLGLSDEERRTYASYQRSLHDDASRALTLKIDLKFACEEAHKKGLEQGHKQGHKKGIEQGLATGLEQGIEEGIKKGMEKGIKKGIEKGMEKGIEQGQEKERAKHHQQLLKIAQSLKQTGSLSNEAIANHTGLSLEDIEKM